MLTEREKNVLTHVLQGKASKEIACTLFLSKRTVEQVKSELIHKLNCKSLYEVIGICFRKKWIE